MHGYFVVSGGRFRFRGNLLASPTKHSWGLNLSLVPSCTHMPYTPNPKPPILKQFGLCPYFRFQQSTGRAFLESELHELIGTCLNELRKDKRKN